MSLTKVKETTYNISRTESVLNVQITGAITDSDRESISQCFQEIITAKETTVHFDLSQVPLMTSQYIGELIKLYRKLREQKREIIIKKIHDELHSLFTSINLTKIISIEN